MKITQIRKRDGRLVKFDKNKIVNAIFKAMQSEEEGDEKSAEKLADKVVSLLERETPVNKVPTVEGVQDIVERVMMEEGFTKVAKSYILYRQKRKEIRDMKALIGVQDELKMSINAIKVLEKRYLIKNNEGKVIETPSQLFQRVAKNIASADKLYGKNDEEVKRLENEFYKSMTALEFMPNSPTLMNAGTDIQQLSACYVLAVEDDMASIFDALKYAALVHQCLVPETLVMTNNGITQLGSVNKNSKIATDEGPYVVKEVLMDTK